MLINNYKSYIDPAEVYNFIKDNNITLELFISSLSIFTGKKLILSSIFNYRAKKINQSREIIDGPIIKPTTQEYNIIQIEDKSIRLAIEKFRKTLEKKLDPELLQIFYKNINSLTVEKVEKIHNKYSIAYYNPYNNVITYKEENVAQIIYHELLHLASSIVNDKGTFLGISQLNENGLIGEGIDEGYTQVLAKRFFPETSDSYDFQTYVAAHIENIIGKNKMMKFYFKADLKSFINELTKYISLDEVNYLINGLDFYTKENRKKETKQFVIFADNFTLKVQKILFKMYLAYYKEIVNENTKSNKELLNDIQKIVSSLDYTITSSNDSFTYSLDNTDILSEIKTCFPNRTKINKIIYFK